jgi:hypothetical protein
MLSNTLWRNIMPNNLTIHVLFAHAARDQLRVLRAKIEHQNPLVG